MKQYKTTRCLCKHIKDSKCSRKSQSRSLLTFLVFIVTILIIFPNFFCLHGVEEGFWDSDFPKVFKIISYTETCSIKESCFNWKIMFHSTWTYPHNVITRLKYYWWAILTSQIECVIEVFIHFSNMSKKLKFNLGEYSDRTPYLSIAEFELYLREDLTLAIYKGIRGQRNNCCQHQ